MPRIVAPWQVVGEATADAARDFGLPAGVPVVAGAGDTAASALGAGIVRPGMLLDVAGTASVLAGCTDRFVADVKNRTLLVMRSVVPGLWHPLAYIGGGGLALRWFRDQFGGAESGGSDPGDMSYSALVEEALNVPPGADGLFFSPHLGGRICPADPARRGAWTGFSWGHTRAHFFRSILESVAFEYSSYLAVLESLAPGLERVEARVVGGGAKSAGWNQIKANVLGVALPAAGAGRPRHLGRRHRGGSRRRTDPRHGGGGSARLGGRLSRAITPEPAARVRLSQHRQRLHRMAEGIGPGMSARPERIRICLIGAGRAGRVHANSIARHIAGAELAAVVDGVRETAASAVADFGVEKKLCRCERGARLGRVRCRRHHHAHLHASRLRGGRGRAPASTSSWKSRWR